MVKAGVKPQNLARAITQGLQVPNRIAPQKRLRESQISPETYNLRDSECRATAPSLRPQQQHRHTHIVLHPIGRRSQK